MKKRFLASVLALVMALSLLPVNALAADYSDKHSVPDETDLAEGDTYTLDTDDASQLPEAPKGLRWDGPESIKGNQIICGKKEHQHDDSCYKLRWLIFFYYERVCNKEEHIHSDYCYNHTYKWKLVNENEITTSNTWRRWWPVYWTLSSSGNIKASDAIESVTAGKNVAYTSSALSSKQALDGTTATLGDAVDAGGFTITTKPGYYVKAARVVCGNYTGCGVSGELVPTGQTEDNYRNTIAIRFDQESDDLNFDHLSANGNGVNLPKNYPTSKPTGNDYHNELKVGRITNTLYPYYFLIQVAQDDRTYSVSYNWGEQTLSSSVPDGKINLKRNENYKVCGPSADAIAEAATKNLAFAGWKYNNSNKIYQVGESFLVSENVTLTAQWTQLYTVSYDLDSGKWKDGETVETAKYPENAPVSVTSNEPERSGYEFIDWTITEPKTNPPKINTDETTDVKTFTMPAANVILMAQWKLIEAAKLSVEKTVTKVGETTVAASKAIPTAYPGDEIEWTITVTNSGNAEGKFKLEDVLQNTAETSLNVTPPDGVSADTYGYYTIPAKSGEDAVTMDFTVTHRVEATDVTGNGLINKVTMKQGGKDEEEAKSDPVPTAMKYTVTYDLAGGKIGTATTYTDSSSPYAKDATVTVAPDPTKEGYTFAGWTATTDNTSVDAPAIDETSKTFTMPAANVTLTATWTVNKYKVTYTDGVENEEVFANVVYPEVTFNTTIPAFNEQNKDATPTRDGYTFTGWTSSVSGITTNSNMPAENVTFTAKWTPNTNTGYTVEYYYQNDNGTYPDTANVTDDTRTGTTGTTASVTDADKADKENGKYTYDSSNATNVESGTIAADGSLTLKLYFKLNKFDYEIEYYYDGESKPFDETTNNVPYGTEVSAVADSAKLAAHYSRKSVNPKLPVTIDKAGIVIKVYYAKNPAGDGTFDFDNIDGKKTPAITKTVKGNVGKNFAETFIVRVKPESKNAETTMTGTSYTGEAEVTYADLTSAFKFAAADKLTFSAAGTYTYTVREVKGETGRMSYDTTEYTLTIEVKLDTEANEYKVTSWKFDANKEAGTPLNIVNTYRAYQPSTPSVTKPALNTDDHYAYVMGYPDGTVQPGGYITRAEASTIFFRLLTDATREEYWAVSNEYTDVKDGDWYNNAISTLSNAGIVSGYPDGTFRPNAPITRAEMSKIIALFAKLDKTNDRFTDIAGHWAEAYIRLAAGNGWIEGYPDGSFRPNQSITRAETVTMINRVLERVPSDEDHLLSERVMLTFPDCKSGQWFYIAIQEATNSHTYERAVTEKNGDEQWTALRDNRDWTKLEY